MWSDLFKSVASDYTFKNASSNEEIKVLELKLNVILPNVFKSLLLESNGVEGEYGLGLIWSTKRIIEENSSFRNEMIFKEIYMPFDNLLFFADNGMGDQFAFPIVNGSICRNDIFVWDHEDDSRKWVAPTVTKYIEWLFNGSINY